MGRVCKVCGTEYLHKKGYVYGNHCSSKCKGALTRRARDQENLNKIHFVENEYTKSKEAYKELLMGYPMSPTGKCYVGLAKAPLIPSENGIGFKGVKVQSENRELIQCFECGGWFKHINHKHVSTHGLTLDEYKEKHGFMRGTALTSDIVSNYYAEQVVKNGLTSFNRLPQEKLNKMLNGNRGQNNKLTSEQENNKGTCPLQLKTQLINYINRFKRVPYKNRGRDGSVKVDVIKYRYGSMNNFLDLIGLPVKKRRGGITEYIFADGFTFFYNHQRDNYLELYNIMLEKCPVLTTNTLCNQDYNYY